MLSFFSFFFFLHFYVLDPALYLVSEIYMDGVGSLARDAVLEYVYRPRVRGPGASEGPVDDPWAVAGFLQR